MAPSLPTTTSSLLFLALLLLCSSANARDFLVGGAAGAWRVPSSSLESLNRWAEANRFQIGDILVWKLDGKKDSVLQVSRADYLSCNTSSPVAESNKDGSFEVRLERAGPYYFVSGKKGACEEGEKVIVVVMARRQAVLSPAPSPAEAESPAAAPMAGGAPAWPSAGVAGGVTMGLGLVAALVL